MNNNQRDFKILYIFGKVISSIGNVISALGILGILVSIVLIISDRDGINLFILLPIAYGIGVVISGLIINAMGQTFSCMSDIQHQLRLIRTEGIKGFSQNKVQNNIIESVKDEYDVVNDLVKILSESDDIAQREAAIEDLSQYNNANAREAIRKALTDKAYAVRSMAVSVIGNDLWDDDKEAILHAYENEEDSVLRKRLKKMLKKIGEEN